MAAYFERPYASPWHRLAAYFADMLVVTLVWLFYSIGAFGGEGTGTEPQRLLAFVLINFAYFTAFTVAFHATPGKLLLGLCIAMLDSSSPEPLHFLVRYCALLVTQMVPLGVVISGFFMWTSPDYQAIHDRIARTVVLRTR